MRWKRKKKIMPSLRTDSNPVKEDEKDEDEQE